MICQCGMVMLLDLNFMQTADQYEIATLLDLNFMQTSLPAAHKIESSLPNINNLLETHRSIMAHARGYYEYYCMMCKSICTPCRL